ncbi:uncharacterized protein LOC128552515 [Mercenaria mercenaria]|uniref:uncharacterized protein LOC128552515 n=1 Tax=Mercenaria mercenaria TaxID=6596 RepID=UPI00234F2C59|nr:uncharacterized protein LOC128552515 [Mercenaria mercenaria]
MAYANVFLRVINSVDYRRLKLFDESGFAVPDLCNPRYGRAPCGERAIEVNKQRGSRNVTLNLMIGADGVAYFNLLDGPSNMDTFTEFFLQTTNATNNKGDFVLKPGDIVILDNCPIHHRHAGRIVSNLLNTMHVEYVFLPTYSPHLNPAELCFQHIKTVFKSDSVARNLAKDNLHFSISHVVNRAFLHRIAVIISDTYNTSTLKVIKVL